MSNSSDSSPLPPRSQPGQVSTRSRPPSDAAVVIRGEFRMNSSASRAIKASAQQLAREVKQGR